MKKNIIIIVLAILVVVYFIFGIIQQIEAESERDAAIKQREIARTEAINYQQKVEIQKHFAEQQKLRADLLQQQLDNCK